MREDTIYDLFYASLSGSASEAQHTRLVELLEGSEEIQQEYVDYVVLFVHFYRREGARVGIDHKVPLSNIEHILIDLGSQEQQAASLVKEKPDVVNHILADDRRAKRHSKKNVRSNILLYAASMAAVLMFGFIVFDNYNKSNDSNAGKVEEILRPVALVTDQLNTEWNAGSAALDTKQKIYTDNRVYDLAKGSIEIEYKTGVDAIVEGPARFRFNENGVDLESGRIYSKVSKRGRGFSVNTPFMRFVDLGTEFGINVDSTRGAELHVIKGLVQYSDNQTNVSDTVTENNAISYSVQSKRTTAIPVQKYSFIRDLDSGSELAWRGVELDVADIVGGGNGFGTGKANSGVDFNKAKVAPVERETPAFKIREFIAVDNPFIDGVFIPDGGSGYVQVSTTGLKYARFPNTKGECYVPVCNNTVIKQGFDKELKSTELILRSEAGVEKLAPRICVHANAGITFDLDAINDSLEAGLVRTFDADFGLLDIEEFNSDVNRQDFVDTDVFILVDGKLSFSHLNYRSTDEILHIKVDLPEDARFLTIVCTEGERNYSDWPLFINPVLIVK